MRLEFKKDLHVKYGRINSLSSKKPARDPNTSRTDRMLFADPYANIIQSDSNAAVSHLPPIPKLQISHNSLGKKK